MPRSRYEDIEERYYDMPETVERSGGAFVSRKGRGEEDLEQIVSKILLAASWLFRVLAYVAVAVVIGSTFGLNARFPLLNSASGLVMTLTPPFFRGAFALLSPFGGVFRGDFAITSIMLFALDWICTRISSSLR